MSTRIYCDACIYLDYLLNRSDRFRPLGDFAFHLFKRIIGCEFELVVSDWVLTELKGHLESEADWNMFMSLLQQLKPKIVKVRTEEADREEARRRCTTDSHWQDNLHAVLAHKAGATILVTRNFSDFCDVQDLVQPRFPENI